MKRYKTPPQPVTKSYIGTTGRIVHETCYGSQEGRIAKLRAESIGLLTNQKLLNSYDCYLCPVIQDGKIGFINDIVRGIKKVIKKDEPKSAVKETAAAVQTVNSGVAPLLKRISLFLEDGNWQEADEYCERVLDSDPENAQAYLYKLMAKMEVRKTEDLRNQAQPFDSEDMYRKTVRFADEELKNTLEEYNAYIKDRNEKKRIEYI